MRPAPASTECPTLHRCQGLVSRVRFASEVSPSSRGVDCPLRVGQRHPTTDIGSGRPKEGTRPPSCVVRSVIYCRHCRPYQTTIQADSATYRERTFFSSRARTGLTRCSSDPASRARCWPSSCPHPLTAMRRKALSGCFARSRRAASYPSMPGHPDIHQDMRRQPILADPDGLRPIVGNPHVGPQEGCWGASTIPATKQQTLPVRC
jgi:hypothetical protein